MNTAQKRKHWRQEKFLPYLLLAPALVLLAGMIYPFALGFYYSFTSYWLQYPNRFRFIWFDNYVNLVTEPLFLSSLEFTLGFTVAAVANVGSPSDQFAAAPQVPLAAVHPVVVSLAPNSLR